MTMNSRCDFTGLHHAAEGGSSSLSSTQKDQVPAWVGVPWTRPSLSSERPGGTLPLSTLNWYGRPEPGSRRGRNRLLRLAGWHTGFPPLLPGRHESGLRRPPRRAYPRIEGRARPVRRLPRKWQQAAVQEQSACGDCACRGREVLPPMERATNAQAMGTYVLDRPASRARPLPPSDRAPSTLARRGRCPRAPEPAARGRPPARPSLRRARIAEVREGGDAVARAQRWQESGAGSSVYHTPLCISPACGSPTRTSASS